MDGWMDGWVDGPIDRSTSTSVLFLALLKFTPIPTHVCVCHCPQRAAAEAQLAAREAEALATVSAKEEDLKAREGRLAERLAQQEGIEAALERVAGELEGEKRRVEEGRAALERER
jgi:acyl transferase domain-containing protein